MAHGVSNAKTVLEIGCGIGTFTGLLIGQLKNGSLLAIDLSPVSIETARNQLNKYRDLELRVVDIVNDAIAGSFDMIVLPDVLEHIPLDQHVGLFKKLNGLLSDSGKILIHAPDPYYADWLRENRPELLQVIDLALHLPRLVEDIDASGLSIQHFQRHSIWTVEPDYMALVLTRKPQSPNYTELREPEARSSMIARLIGSVR